MSSCRMFADRANTAEKSSCTSGVRWSYSRRMVERRNSQPASSSAPKQAAACTAASPVIPPVGGGKPALGVCGMCGAPADGSGVQHPERRAPTRARPL